MTNYNLGEQLLAGWTARAVSSESEDPSLNPGFGKLKILSKSRIVAYIVSNKTRLIRCCWTKGSSMKSSQGAIATLWGRQQTNANRVE